MHIDLKLRQQGHYPFLYRSDVLAAAVEDMQGVTPREPAFHREHGFAVLIEHTAGHFPLWLTPDQVAILPVSDKFNDYAFNVKKQLEDANVRAFVDDRSEKVGRKIRDNEMKHIPYLLIVGENEANSATVSVRKQGEGDQGVLSVAEFAKKIADEIAEMTRNY